MALTSIALNCSLKGRSDEQLSTDKMIGLVGSALAKHGVEFTETVRIVDHDVMPGVTLDQEEGDAWPDVHRRILAADILIFRTPVWLGQMSSIAKRMVERMDAFLSETDEQGRMPSYGKVAVLAIVGNEDGAHGISADLIARNRTFASAASDRAGNSRGGWIRDNPVPRDLPKSGRSIMEADRRLTAVADIRVRSSLREQRHTPLWLRLVSHGSRITPQPRLIERVTLVDRANQRPSRSAASGWERWIAPPRSRRTPPSGAPPRGRFA